MEEMFTTAGNLCGAEEAREPIVDFKTIENLLKSAKEWQERLFLGEWYIEYSFANGEEIPDMSGISHVVWENGCGTIGIRKADQMPSTMTKCPQELTLVHELLHFKYMSFHESKPTIEGMHWDAMQHKALEQMAKALLMAKYNLKPSWFRAYNL